MKPTLVGTCFAIVFEVCAATAAASPQSVGKAVEVVIQVRDPGAGAIPGAHITIAPSPGEQIADSKGNLSLWLPPGEYEVTAASQGFHAESKHIQVSEGAGQTVEIILTIGAGGHVTMDRPEPETEPQVISDPNPYVLVPESEPAETLVTPCSERDLNKALLPSDHVYSYAVELGAELDRAGLRVRCMLPSKMQRIFHGQAGAAFFRTEEGDLDALFLPRSSSFDHLEISEQLEGGRYLYQFRGVPRSRVHMDGSRRADFVVYHNVLLLVPDDHPLAETLRSKLR